MQRKTEHKAAVADIAWRPSADLEALRARAALAREIRAYFAATDVLEVHTPLLMPAGSPDPALHHFVAHAAGSHADPAGFLQTSPEFALKRLLAAGSGDVYQFAPVFRDRERGRHHLAEFMLIEWYRLGFDHHALMDDVERLFARVLPGLTLRRASYAGLFGERYGIDPHSAPTTGLAGCATRAGAELGADADDRAAILDALFADLFLRDHDQRTDGVFIYDFPVEQAAYARIDPGPPPVAQRFELVVRGIEIANGYFEVTDPAEQAARMRDENARRTRLGLATITPDPHLLAALEAGLPPCAGVALGFDRLAMIATGATDIAQVSAFT